MLQDSTECGLTLSHAQQHAKQFYAVCCEVLASFRLSKTFSF